MKKSLILIVMFVSTFNKLYSQTPAQLPTGQQYYNSNTNYNQLYNALQQKQAQYDQNQNYLYALLEWCLKLTSQVNELEFQNGVNYYYKQLKNLEDSDLSIAGTTLKKIENSIKEEISNYENRFKEQNNPEKFWNEGNNLFKGELFTSAIEKYSKVIELSPNYAPAYYQRALCYFYKSEHKNAIKDFSKALIEDEDLAKNTYSYRGYSYSQIGDNYSALSDYSKYLEIIPNDANIYLQRGLIKSSLKDYIGSNLDYRKAIEVNPTFSMAYNNIAWNNFLMKKYNEALTNANKAIELDQTNYVAWDTRAEIKLILKNYNGCISDCNKAIELDPKLSNSYLLRGKAKIALMKKTEGCIDLSKAGELGSESAYVEISKNCN